MNSGNLICEVSNPGLIPIISIIFYLAASSLCGHKILASLFASISPCYRFEIFFRTDSPLRNFVVRTIETEMRKVVKDPELVEKLIPEYDMGCKRITPSYNYLHTFNRDNVKLVTDPIKGLLPPANEVKGR